MKKRRMILMMMSTGNKEKVERVYGSVLTTDYWVNISLNAKDFHLSF